MSWVQVSTRGPGATVVIFFAVRGVAWEIANEVETPERQSISLRRRNTSSELSGFASRKLADRANYGSIDARDSSPGPEADRRAAGRRPIIPTALWCMQACGADEALNESAW